jgi:prolyl 3-hydroxylase /prolyl 3,4-dihydroxylase
MKRKFSPSAAAPLDGSPTKKRPASPRTDTLTTSCFRTDLLHASTLSTLKSSYATATPYPHAVLPSILSAKLLASVRHEIRDNLAFTLKETDIYRIYQTGDLANLDGLDGDSLAKLPSLKQLRDGLYSAEFRRLVEGITSAGRLSGSKTDMAVNVYTPGCYLLCHDDVIGSRRVSYILYLTESGSGEWKSEWGGRLRLYGTDKRLDKEAQEIRVPKPMWEEMIPPQSGQMSLFAVRGGESYHDVEEVYWPESQNEDGKERVRMAISGWYHIPQEGEEGYEEETSQHESKGKSSLAQLEQGSADEFEEPQQQWVDFDEPRVVVAADGAHEEVVPGAAGDEDELMLSEQDLTFLLQFIAPSYLTPDITEQIAESFQENSLLQLEDFLHPRFATELRSYIESHDQGTANGVAHEDKNGTIKAKEDWPVARPPHKHRFTYLQPPSPNKGSEPSTASPIFQLLTSLLRSHAFKKWLALITGVEPASLLRLNVLARRFRQGLDYSLASEYRRDEPQLEFTIGLTPSGGWAEEEDERENNDNDHAEGTNGHSNGSVRTSIIPSNVPNRMAGRVHGSAGQHGELDIPVLERRDVGGDEVYMAGDDDDEVESAYPTSMPHTGRKSKADPAVYKSAGDGEEEEEGILFTESSKWNSFSVVLRDKGTLRFVKYVSIAAQGSRWDIKGEVELGPGAWEGPGDNSDAGL